MSAATTLPAARQPVETQPPRTIRSATGTILPRSSSLAYKHEAANLIAVMRMNVDFLRSILRDDAPTVALDALKDLASTVDRLEHRFSSSLPVGFRRTG